MIVRAWKDPEYRAQVTADIPESPVGSADVASDELCGEAYLSSPVEPCSIGALCTMVVAC
ncbi:MAG TPA: mersacidin/lichenicidin family type 2 lantibiotic [Kofleriaceae bacterium]